jgi:general secretion pathway protein H
MPISVPGIAEQVISMRRPDCLLDLPDRSEPSGNTGPDLPAFAAHGGAVQGESGQVRAVANAGAADRSQVRQAASQGFTLLEILVVLVIIGIVLSLAVVRMDPPADRQLQQEAERLALLFEAARDEAIARSEPVAWSHTERKHQFWIRKDADWQPLTGVDVLVPRELPAGVSFGAIKVNLQPQGEDGKLVFQPSGVNELFQVLLLGEGGLFELASDVLGRVQVSRQDAVTQG